MGARVVPPASGAGGMPPETTGAGATPPSASAVVGFPRYDAAMLKPRGTGRRSPPRHPRPRESPNPWRSHPCERC
jgi:hypothetical protein